MTETKRDVNYMNLTERSMVTAMRGVQFNDRKRAKDLMLTIVLKETTHQMAIANSVHLHGHILRRAPD